MTLVAFAWGIPIGEVPMADPKKPEAAKPADQPAEKRAILTSKSVQALAKCDRILQAVDPATARLVVDFLRGTYCPVSPTPEQLGQVLGEKPKG